MTKFILVGGYPWKAMDGGRAFAEELVAGFGLPAKVLVCLFARPEEGWPKAYGDDVTVFNGLLGEGRAEFRVANHGDFLGQLAWADAVYFRGGDVPVLLEGLARHPGWEGNLGGKTVAGSSAGADMLTAHHYDIDSLRLADGLGIVQAKTVTHYRSDYNAPNVDWDRADAELDAYGGGLPTFRLREGEFTVVSQ